ncbi:MAG: hypothetical protein IKB62_00900 [Oscillospiraceae bacterium]|nr:hypothetical protein [Oscillospiraceae bacterium]
MKKIFALALAAVLALSMVACGGSEPAPAPAEPEVYKTGMGTVISASVTEEDAENEKGASAQINTNIVVATFDKDGKIVSATIDVAQQKASFDLEGKKAADVDLRTKVEKGDDYGMRGVSAIGKEVNEQYAALAEYFVGKTVEEIKAMPTFERDANHTAVPDVEDLKASVTITIQDYVAALEEAYNTAIETTGVPAKTGLGTVISASVTDEDAENEKGASAQINTNMMAVALDENGVIVAAILDVAQQKAAFDLEGKKAGEVDLRTKVEKEGDYGMKGVSGIGKEYFEQAKALTDWMTGKTVEEVLAMPTYQRDESHTACPDVEDLKSSVTITVGDYLAALEEAAANAK